MSRAAPVALPRPRLLACDIDGTILDPDGTLRPRVRDAIRMVAMTGVEVILVTGRSPWSGVAALCDALGLTGPQLTMQGALLSVPGTGEVLRMRALPPATYREALRFAAELGIDPIVALLHGHRAERLPDLLDFVTPEAAESGHFRYTLDLDQLMDERPMRVFLPTVAGRHARVRAAAQDRFAGRGAVVWGDLSGVEILAPGVNKGEAVAWYARTRGVTLDEVAAVGDAANDTELLRVAGRSAAMGPAPTDVRLAADVTVGSSEDDGVLEALAWFFPDLAASVTAH